MHRVPKHIGIIPDGNRRWAAEHGLGKEQGYAHGLAPGKRLLRAAREAGVRELTYYGFTVENCRRPQAQVQAFSEACVAAAESIRDEDVSIYVLGDTASPCFPTALLPYTRRQTDARMTVNLLVHYGWRWDMRSGWASRDVPAIDLVIRWGGMRRLSGFLPLQSAYADICVLDELWPDFDEAQFRRALDWYDRQDVTRGG